MKHKHGKILGTLLLLAVIYYAYKKLTGQSITLPAFLQIGAGKGSTLQTTAQAASVQKKAASATYNPNYPAPLVAFYPPDGSLPIVVVGGNA